MADRGRGERWGFWWFLAWAGALASFSAWSVLDGRTGDGGLAAVCTLAILLRPAVGAFAAIVAAAFGAPLVIAALAVGATLPLLRRTLVARLPRRRSPDPSALAEAVAAIPGDLLYSARIRAGLQPLTTWHLVDAARRANPGLWEELLKEDPGAHVWDGPAVQLGERAGAVTLFFAEAAGLSAEISVRHERPVDPDLLGVAACSVPLSAAENWQHHLERTVGSVLGIPLVDLVESQVAFSRTTAGRDIARRARVGFWARRLGVDDREFIFQLGGGSLPRLVLRWLAP